jgi:hypothetical protein
VLHAFSDCTLVEYRYNPCYYLYILYVYIYIYILSIFFSPVLLLQLLQCSMPCGQGIQLRIVKCAFDNWETTDDDRCDVSKRPPDYRICKIRSCHPKPIKNISRSDSPSSYFSSEQPTTPYSPRWEIGEWNSVSVFACCCYCCNIFCYCCCDIKSGFRIIGKLMTLTCSKDTVRHPAELTFRTNSRSTNQNRGFPILFN